MTTIRKTTMHDERGREDCNWFAPIYVVDEGPDFWALPSPKEITELVNDICD